MGAGAAPAPAYVASASPLNPPLQSTEAFPPAEAPTPTKKKSKKPLIIVVGAALLVILVVVAWLAISNMNRDADYEAALALIGAGEYRQAYDAFDKLGDYEDAVANKELARKWLDYEAALALFDRDDYESARAAFEALGGFGDAREYATLCQRNIEYVEAVEAFEQGDYDAALRIFGSLSSSGFSDAADWEKRVAYAQAEELYDEGDIYGAYKAFKELGSFLDSAARMANCTLPIPNSGEHYHNPSYVSSASAIAIDAVNANYLTYFKIYSGDTLVSTIFLNPGARQVIEVPPGNYTIKEASGDLWFGEEILFGDDGYYEVMLFDSGNEYFYLEDNIITTITLDVSDNDPGNSVGGKPTGRGDF
jgi:tetratricopeptide (TPR) repeat protein